MYSAGKHAGRSVFSRFFGVVDDEDFDGSLRSFQFQAELLLDGVENGRRIVRGLKVLEHLAIHRVFDGGLEMKIENSADAGTIDNRTLQGSTEKLSEPADRYSVHEHVEVVLKVDVVSADACRFLARRE